MHGMLSHIADRIKSGVRFDHGTDADDILDGYRCLFRSIPPHEIPEYLGFAHWFYKGAAFPALQCIWPDRAGLYPWDEEASNELRRRQPILARP
jgi:hypothetical protein